MGNYEKVAGEDDDLYLWRGLNIGTHHLDFVIFFIEILQDKIAQ